MSTHITEIIPENQPEWFAQALKDGQVFARSVEIVAELEAANKELLEGFSGAVKRLESCSAFYEGSPPNKRDRALIAKHNGRT